MNVRKVALGVVMGATTIATSALGLHELERVSALSTSFSPLMADRESVLVNGYETLAGLLLLRDVSGRVTTDPRDDVSKLRALVDWTHENVRPQYAAPDRLVADNVYSIVRRGFGDCDQSAHVFATLATLVGYDARLLFLFDEIGSSPHTIAQVLFEGRWIMVDPWLGVLPTDRAGHPLTVEDLAATPTLLAEIGYSSQLPDLRVEDFLRGRPFRTFPYAAGAEVIQRAVTKIRGIPVVDPSMGTNVSRPPPAETSARSSGPIRPDEAELLTYERARIAQLRGDYAAAVRSYRLLPTDQMGPELVESVRFFTGLALYRAGRTQEAIDQFTVALGMDAGGLWSKSLLRYRGQARIEVGDPGGVRDLRAADTPIARRILRALGDSSRY